MKITFFEHKHRDGQITTNGGEEVTEEFYRNYIASIPFFDNWGKEGKGYCKGKKTNTPYGRMITDVITVSPWGDTTIKAHFEFD